MGSALVLGAVFGAVIGGHLSDRLGRKDVFLADMALLAVAAFVLTLADSVAWVLAGQFLIGTRSAWISPRPRPTSPRPCPPPSGRRWSWARSPSRRSAWCWRRSWACGCCGLSGQEEAWRLLFAAIAVVAVLFFALRLTAAREPALARRARPDGRGGARGAAAEPGPDDQRADGRATAARPRSQHGYGALFGPAFLRLTILTAGSWFLMDIATYGVGIFTPVILQSLDPASGVNSTLVYREIHVGRASGLVDLFLLLGFLMGIWLVPRVGAIRMQAAGFAGMVAGMLVLAWAVGPADR